MVYTLGEAAKVVGKSKATLSKAIKSGKMSAHRNDNGSFSIDPSELQRVYPIPPSETVSNKRMETPEGDLANTQRIMELRIKLEAAQQRIDELSEDRDQWRQQANRLLSYTPSTPQTASFWERLFGKK